MFVKKQVWVILFVAFVILFTCLNLTSDINENFSENRQDAPLKSYLAFYDNGKYLKNYDYGYQQYTIPPCSVPQEPGDTSSIDFGNAWTAVYKNGDINTFCVPEVYSSSNAYVPCGSGATGPPDIRGCGPPDTPECNTEIKAIRKDFDLYKKFRGVNTKAEIQQYAYACEKDDKGKKICPCMGQWGRDYKPYKCDAKLKGYTCKGTGYGVGTNKKACVEIQGGGDYNTLEECNQACNPKYPNGFSCKGGGLYALIPSGGDYPTLDKCHQNCGPPYINGFSCKGGGLCASIPSGGDYPTLDKCHQNCGPPYINGFSCKGGGMCALVSSGGDYPTQEKCRKICGKPGPEPDISGVGDSLGNTTACYKYPFPQNLNDDENTTFFNKKCKTDPNINVPSATLSYITSKECPSPGWARGICSLTSPKKVTKLP